MTLKLENDYIRHVFFFIITCWYKHDNGIDMEERKLKYGKQKEYQRTNWEEQQRHLDAQ